MVTPYSVGVDLGGTHIKAVVVNPWGEVLGRETRETHDGFARIGKPPAQSLAVLLAQNLQFGFQFLEPVFQTLARRHAGLIAAFIGPFGIERLRAFGAVTVNGIGLEHQLPAEPVGILDIFNAGYMRHIDRF